MFEKLQNVRKKEFYSSLLSRLCQGLTNKMKVNGSA